MVGPLAGLPFPSVASTCTASSPPAVKSGRRLSWVTTVRHAFRIWARLPGCPARPPVAKISPTCRCVQPADGRVSGCWLSVIHHPSWSRWAPVTKASRREKPYGAGRSPGGASDGRSEATHASQCCPAACCRFEGVDAVALIGATVYQCGDGGVSSTAAKPLYFPAAE